MPMEIYSHLGDAGIGLIGFCLMLLTFPQTRKAGVTALLAMLLGALCTNVVLKQLIARPRPWLEVEGLIPLVYPTDPNSFPSGHTCAAFAAAISWARQAPNRGWKVLAVVSAVLMGWTRLYLGVHYPSDVLAGALIGTLCALAVWWGERILQKAETTAPPSETGARNA